MFSSTFHQFLVLVNQMLKSRICKNICSRSNQQETESSDKITRTTCNPADKTILRNPIAETIVNATSITVLRRTIFYR
ncbi:hypothetical protein VIBNISO65_1420018 [Vibrio nigripulchritudo SO65]|nr:hypothetical protein VIBNIFTn2_1050042 [Vibrio nigripulchritudo FTn2]CCN75635.1 hypothetical protein VIBNISO65_1420018 [Vibrio nigripulchritudo SO65]